MIPPNVPTITRRAYNLPVTFHGLVLRSNHERLRLKRIESRRIRVEELLNRIRQDIRDKVRAKFVSLFVMSWVMPCPMTPIPMMAGSRDSTPNDKLRTLSAM